MKKIKLGILIVSLIGINLALVIKLKADTKLTSVEQNNKTIMGCIEGLNSKKPPKNMTVDEWKEAKQQCIYLLAEMKPDPKIVLPTLIDHMKNDPDENIRGVIINSIIYISGDKEVITALRNIAKEPLSDDYILAKVQKNSAWNRSDSLQAAAIRSLAGINDEGSISVIVEWLIKYDVDFLDFRGMAIDPENKVGTLNKSFADKCDEEMNKRLNDKTLSSGQKMSIVNAKIIALNKAPYEYKKYFIEALNDKNEKTVESTMEKIEFMSYDNRVIKDVEGKKKLINELKSDIKKIKGEKYEKMKNVILGGK